MGSVSQPSTLNKYEWGEHRLVTIQRNQSEKFGFKFRSIPLKKISGDDETLTVISKVKEDFISCSAEKKLYLYDRIVKINDVNITKFDETGVKKLLSGACELVNLEVCRAVPRVPHSKFLHWLEFLLLNGENTNSSGRVQNNQSSSVKRTISSISRSSDRSSSSSMDRKQNVKRMGRTVSGGSGNSAGSSAVRDELLNVCSPSLFSNGYAHIDRTTSVPIEDISLQDIKACVDEGRTQSLPLGSCSPYHQFGDLRVFSSKRSNTSFSPDTLEHMLEHPEHIMWEDNTEVVKITRKRSGSFGFKFKTKPSENKGVTELFTLVEKIVPNSPAYEHLHKGDYLRSVNYNPIQHAQELSDVCRKSLILRLVIQRPLGLSCSCETLKSEQKCDNAENSRPDLPLQTDVLHDPINLPGSPSGIDGLPQYKMSPLKQKQVINKSCLPPRKNSNSANNLPSETVKCQHFIKQILSTCEHGTVKLQRVRIIVCGQEACNFASYVVSKSDFSCNANKIHPNNHFSCLRFAIKLCKDGRIILSDWDSDLENKYTRVGDMKSEARSGEMSVNVEMFVFRNEKFFHYFGHSLVSPSSLLIVTFDCARLLQNSASELTNLSNLLHTACSQTMKPPNVILYGIINNASPECSADEVKTLFLTSVGHFLKKYTSEMPEVISVDSNSDQVCLMRIFEKLLDVVNYQEIALPVAAAIEQIDMLSSSREMIKLDLLLNGIAVLYSCNVPTVATVLYNLRIVTCLMIDKHKGILSLDKVTTPAVMLSLLETVANIPNKYDELKDSATISKEILREILSNDLWNDASRHLQFLEDLQLLYTVPKLAYQCSSQEEEEYLIPYFLTDSSVSTETEEIKLFVETDVVMATRIFFTFALKLASVAESSSVDWQGEKSCVIKCVGFHITLQYSKVQNSIAISLRESVGVPKMKVCVQWILQTCISTFPPDMHYRFGPACPCEICHKRYVIDLRLTSPVYCHNKRIEVQPQFRHYFKYIEEQTLSKASIPEPVPKIQGSTCSPGIGLKTKIKDLPWSIMNNLGVKLSITNSLGRDWKGLAGVMGKLTEEVTAYESITYKSPAYELLRNWGRQENATVEDLINLLKKPELAREDIIKYLEDEMKSQDEHS